MDDVLETVELQTGEPVQASVIWLHGLGADGHDFEPVVPALRLHGLNVRFVFPHAPVRPVTLNSGMRMRAWYDVVGLELDSRVDETGLRQSGEELERLIRRENERGIKHERIVIAGFSQGGAVALFCGLRHAVPLCGVIALSSYLPLCASFDDEAHEANRRTPIFVGHGTADPLVPLALGEGTREFLSRRNYDVTWKTYPIPHSISPEEILDLGAWLRERL